MDKANVIDYFEKKIHPIDKNGNIKFEENGKLYRYKFKDRVFNMSVKIPETQSWVRVVSVYYSDIEYIDENNKLKLKGTK